MGKMGVSERIYIYIFADAWGKWGGEIWGEMGVSGKS